MKRRLTPTFAIMAAASLLAIPAAEAEATSPRGRPLGLAQPFMAASDVAMIRMPAVDVAAYRAEDVALAQSGRVVPFRFAAPIKTSITPARDGSWETLPNGWLLWRLRIVSPGALNLNLWLDRINLPAGSAPWLYDGSGAVVQGPYTSSDRNALGELWTPTVLGDELVVELDLPPGAEGDADLRIASVNHGYRSIGDETTATQTKQGSCNIDVICPEGDDWRDQIRSVARLIILGSYLCTGQLLNTTAQDETPYMLTAQHCVEDAYQATTVIAFWNYESPACGMLSGGISDDHQIGATLVSSWQWLTGSDFSLILLDEMPDPSFNVYYSGWDATGDAPLGSVGIHHPSGDEKALALNDDLLLATNHYGHGSHQWEVSEWEQGTTEGGSSGSCLYDPASRLCVGTLTAGTASCTNPSGYDIYGRMDAHWTGNGTPTSRLSDWLDPLGIGDLTLAGRDSDSTIFFDGFETGNTSRWSASSP